MLTKLLRTTNTLSEAKDQPHRYKVRAGGLPTFGNPVEPAVKNFGGVRPERVKVEPQARTAGLARGDGWVKKLNPFATQGAPVPRAAVQGELSLDNVKPVRNDLSDTDLELVAAVKQSEAITTAVKSGAVEVPVVKVVTFLERVRGLVRRLRP